MGRIVKQIKIIDFFNQEDIYSRQIKGGKEFDLELHNLEGGSNLQLTLIRPGVDIECGAFKKYKYSYDTNAQQIKLCINEEIFMLSCSKLNKIDIEEYNLDGKAIVNISLIMEEKNDNSKFCTEIKKYFKAEEDQ